VPSSPRSRRRERGGRALVPVLVVVLATLAGLYWRWRAQQG
jgi:hypothetical protein